METTRLWGKKPAGEQASPGFVTAVSGGCAAKFPAARLEELLAGFLPLESANLLVGLSPADDAAVYRLDDERALVFTVDFFPPLVDEPRAFGAIAATNALNDVYAMGGRPLLALSIAAFPEELARETIAAVLAAADAKVREAGALLAGGHTLRDDEPKYGLAVVGTVRPDGVWTKSAARPGDALFLTKPLGTGIVLTAVRRELLGIDEYEAAVQAMTTLNRDVAEAIRPYEPSAVTDVTGFGLFGHAMEMATRSEVLIVVDAQRLPGLPGALVAARGGLRTGGDARNREYVEGRVELRGIPPELEILGFDPQTAGGLLVALPSNAARVFKAALDATGIEVWEIGRVEEGPSGVVVD